MLTAILTAALLAATPPPERLDALALDNGAVLVQSGGAYTDGVGQWSAWGLTDQDLQSGWCSPEGKPTGLAFVWDLDTVWSLETLVLSNQALQEDGYPGISARLLELWLAPPGGAFQKVGTFTLAKGERKAFPLPKGTTAKQARLVVAANHGNASYTELGEVELLGTRAGPSPQPKVSGDYLTTYGPIRLLQDGEEVVGCYDYTEGATLEGTVVGRNVRVTWAEPAADGTVRKGTAIFTVRADGGGLQGVWFEGGRIMGEWSGPLAPQGQGPRCTPRKKGALERLKKEGRLVLYGIRFDTDSAVPRPESDATLDQVAGLLREDPALKLKVEGHTDAQASDAHNLELSKRRAQAVVEALQKRGADGKRLVAEGFGRTRPVADNATAQGRALNRRVEVSVLR